jgi:hypothetical protein
MPGAQTPHALTTVLVAIVPRAFAIALKARHRTVRSCDYVWVAQLRSPQHRASGQHRQHDAIARVEQRARNVVRQAWFQVAQLVLIQQVRTIPVVGELLPQHRHHLEVFVCLGEIQSAGWVVVKATDLLVQFAPQLDAGLGERVFLRVVRRDHQVPHAAARSATGNGTAIAQHDTRGRIEQLRQVIDDRAANDAAANDDDVRGFTHGVRGQR